MSFFKKLTGKSDEEILKEKVRKEADQQAKKSMEIAEYFSIVSECKRRFEETIMIERLNALERREKRIGDAAQKERIHAAAVGLLAIEELEIDLQSASRTEELKKAQKKLGYVVRQLGRLDPNTSISKKNLQDNMNALYEDTNETESFVERAELVDEQFVEYLIQGFTMEQCVQKSVPGGAAAGSTGKTYDFSTGNKQEDAEYIDDILRRNASKH